MDAGAMAFFVILGCGFVVWLLGGLLQSWVGIPIFSPSEWEGVQVFIFLLGTVALCIWLGPLQACSISMAIVLLLTLCGFFKS